MSWRSIRLELGSTGEFPTGSVGRAYLLQLPLDDRDFVDREAFEQNPSRASVRRHWSTEPDQRGMLTHSGAEWTMLCQDCERVLRLDGTPLRLNQQVTVVEPDGRSFPYKIASVR